MSLEERSGHRPLLYSRWHRPNQISRYLSHRDAARLTAIDVDFAEVCPYCKKSLALIETERSNKRIIPKPAPIMANLARAASIPAYSVLYVPKLPLTECNECGELREDPDDEITLFYVRQIEPEHDIVIEQTPEEYAGWLLSLRTDCACLYPKSEAV